MGWFSDLFKKRAGESPHKSPTIEPDKPWPRGEGDFVILPKGAIYVPPKDISEPVYAIVKAMQERPSSFKVRYSTEISKSVVYPIHTYIGKDTKTKQEINMTVGYGYRSYAYSCSWKWLTPHEISFLVEAYTEIYKDKQNRLKNMQRAAMKAIYK